ncbi:MAG: hypothetical protein Q4P34_04550 [Tissierellia bacterium]|nr:hypothetical protein [Tissierellia bacterium]
MRLIKRLAPILLLIIAILIAICNFGVENSLLNTIYIAYKFLFTVFMTLIVQKLISELSRVACGVFNNYSFIGFQILGITIFREGENFKLRLDGFNNDFCLAVMAPNNEVTDNNHINYYRSGYLANILTLIPISMAFYFGRKNYVILIIAVTVIMIISRMIPREAGGNFNDGYLVRLFKNKKREDHELAGIYQKLQTELIIGTRPKDLPLIKIRKEENVFAVFINLYIYYKGIDIKDEAIIQTRIRQIEERYEILNSRQRQSIIYEFIYYYSFIARDNFTASKFYAEIEDKIEVDHDINARRVLAYYNYYSLLDPEKAADYAQAGLAVADDYPISGIAKMEIEALNNLLEKIEGENNV